MDSNLEDGRLPVGTGLPMNGAAKAAPPSVGIPDASNFRIVCLQVSKKEPGRSLHSMTQHWGYYDSEDEAVGAAMRKIDDLKPGFSVDGSLVASPFAIAIEAGTAETEGLGAQHESAGRRHRHDGEVAAPIPVEGEVFPEGWTKLADGPEHKVIQADRDLMAALHMQTGGGPRAASRYQAGVFDDEPELELIAKFRALSSRLTFSRGVDEVREADVDQVKASMNNAIAQVAADAIRSSFFTSVSGGGCYYLSLAYPTMEAMHNAEDHIKAFIRWPQFLPLEKRLAALHGDQEG